MGISILIHCWIPFGSDTNGMIAFTWRTLIGRHMVAPSQAIVGFSKLVYLRWSIAYGILGQKSLEGLCPCCSLALDFSSNVFQCQDLAATEKRQKVLDKLDLFYQKFLFLNRSVGVRG